VNGNSWASGPYLAFDTETTGVNVAVDRIVTAAIVDIRPGQEPRTRTWLVNPGVEIPAEATAVHGVTTEQARAEGVHPSVALDEISLEIETALASGVPLVAMNAAYDLTLLDRELIRYRLGSLGERLGGYDALRPVLDPMVLDREVDKYRKGKRTLTALCQHYKVTLDEAHAAHADALAACRVLFRIAQYYPRVIGAVDPHELHDRQIAWHAERQADFAKYLHSKGEDPKDIDGSWPIRRPLQERAA
jgi:DNA polymerase-3 subunit epsilon